MNANGKLKYQNDLKIGDTRTKLKPITQELIEKHLSKYGDNIESVEAVYDLYVIDDVEQSTDKIETFIKPPYSKGEKIKVKLSKIVKYNGNLHHLNETIHNNLNSLITNPPFEYTDIQENDFQYEIEELVETGKRFKVESHIYGITKQDQTKIWLGKDGFISSTLISNDEMKELLKNSTSNELDQGIKYDQSFNTTNTLEEVINNQIDPDEIAGIEDYGDITIKLELFKKQENRIKLVNDVYKIIKPSEYLKVIDNNIEALVSALPNQFSYLEYNDNENLDYQKFFVRTKLSNIRHSHTNFSPHNENIIETKEISKGYLKAILEKRESIKEATETIFFNEIKTYIPTEALIQHNINLINKELADMGYDLDKITILKAEPLDIIDQPSKSINVYIIDNNILNEINKQFNKVKPFITKSKTKNKARVK